MRKYFRSLYFSLNERLWFRPLVFSVLSIMAALLAHFADGTELNKILPAVNVESLEVLLRTLIASMLVIAVFTVSSMVSAFSAVSSSATPRAFKLVIRDDVSQTALSVFIGAFIFGTVGIVALKNGYYETTGYIVLFILTFFIFGLVILTFLKWVDRISRLGRINYTIKLLEDVTLGAMKMSVDSFDTKKEDKRDKDLKGSPIYSSTIGYVQKINIKKLQDLAEKWDLFIQLSCLTGSFIGPGRAIAFVYMKENQNLEIFRNEINKFISIGIERVFEEDPRFGLVALCEIADKALSPGINDPGTAIEIIRTFIRVFSSWNEIIHHKPKSKYDRLEIPSISVDDLFIDAFRPIARDGASIIEVMICMQKAFQYLGSLDNQEMKKAARHHSEETFNRAKSNLESGEDLQLLKKNTF